MKKLLLISQVLAVCSLPAQSEVAASSKSVKNQSNKNGAACVDYQRGDDAILGSPMNCQYPASYNLAGGVKVNSCCDFYGDVSYIYWYVGEESMDLAVPVQVQAGGVVIPSQSKGNPVFQSFNYTSGFKVGIGSNLNVDDWVADLEYTYLRQSTSTSKTAPEATQPTYTGDFLFTSWFGEKYASSEPFVAPSFSSKWKYAMDWIDLTFKRPFYQGRRLVVTPSVGLRASLIRQNLQIQANNAYPIEEDVPHLDLSHNNSNSWGIGPRTLVEGHWLVGGGFRFQGNVGGSLLFTQFTKVSHSETGSAEIYVGNGPSYEIRNYNCLRAMAEGNLGIGWGRYFDQNKYHLDLTATYDFNYLWSQNMMKYLAELNGFAYSGTADDLYLHGLTIKARFDF